MITSEQILWEIVKKIEPSLFQKEAAARSHNYLRGLLNQGEIGERITNSYLSGSYSRDTAIAPIDDVDIIFIIQPDKWRNLLEILAKKLPDTSSVLNSFANAIRYRYPVSSVFGQRRSVRLSLNHLDIDVVPAIESGNETIHVPDKDSNTWILSSPKNHSANATMLNKKFDGKFKPLVKLIKYWNSTLPNNARLKSFTIETILVRLFYTSNLESLTQGLHFFFDFFSYLMGRPAVYQWKHPCGMKINLFQRSIPDAASTGSNTAQGINWITFSNFLRSTEAARYTLFESTRGSDIKAISNKIFSIFKIT